MAITLKELIEAQAVKGLDDEDIIEMEAFNVVVEQFGEDIAEDDVPFACHLMDRAKQKFRSQMKAGKGRGNLRESRQYVPQVWQ